jgi:hypothetical protein
MHKVVTVIPKQHLQKPSVVVEDSDQPQVISWELNLGACGMLADVCWQFQCRLVEISRFGHVFIHGLYQPPRGAKWGDALGASRMGFVPICGKAEQFYCRHQLWGHIYVAREDVVAELILMVNVLYRIMSVAMLNYEWCLALRSVLGTSGVWRK